MLPDPIQKFIRQVSALPSIGPRQATRLAFHLIRQGKMTINDLSGAIAGLNSVGTCSNCFNIMTSQSIGLCEICVNPSRRVDVIAVVEKETDLLSLEKSKKFNGKYLIIGEIEKNGVLTSLQKLRINHLKNVIKKFPPSTGSEQAGGQAEEIIIALNPTSYGDLDAALIIQELKPFAKKITRLGRGLPTGGEIEFADEETLGGALEHRS